MTPLSEALAYPLAHRLSRILPMGGYRKRRLEKELSVAGMEMTPEYYVAFAVVMGLYAAVPALLLFLFAAVSHSMIFALFGVVFLVAAVLVVWLEMHRTGKRARELREELEAEMPRLTAAVRQGLEATPDVYYILDRYRAMWPERPCAMNWTFCLRIWRRATGKLPLTVLKSGRERTRFRACAGARRHRPGRGHADLP